MRLSKKFIVQFHKTIFEWWQENKRDLPWRHTHDPYKILLSEVMLQQTQVPRVLSVYTEFLKKFPTVVDLANASTGDVLRAWKGMGYNRRALYLKKAAQSVVFDYNGIFPRDRAILNSLSGVGEYTAGAIQVFAYKMDVSMVDTNIRKIITHFFFDDIPQKERVILDVAERLVPIGKSWQWHQALMDYGALVMAKQKRIKKFLRQPRVPFVLTNRFFRGQILDDLRVRPRNLRTLKEKYINEHLVSDERMDLILKKLRQDGLVEITDGVIQLPW